MHLSSSERVRPGHHIRDLHALHSVLCGRPSAPSAPLEIHRRPCHGWAISCLGVGRGNVSRSGMRRPAPGDMHWRPRLSSRRRSTDSGCCTTVFQSVWQASCGTCSLRRQFRDRARRAPPSNEGHGSCWTGMICIRSQPDGRFRERQYDRNGPGLGLGQEEPGPGSAPAGCAHGVRGTGRTDTRSTTETPATSNAPNWE